ncbi:MAG: Smr/MutS family protein [Polyangiales bacterium]
MTLWTRIRRWLAPPPYVPRYPDPSELDARAQVSPSAIPLDGVLDLHHFRPAEVGDVVDAYIAACRDAGVLALRVVHGKGKGVLRRTVHARLARSPAVKAYRLAPPERGGWGATLVDLHPPREPS